MKSRFGVVSGRRVVSEVAIIIAVMIGAIVPVLPKAAPGATCPVGEIACPSGCTDVTTDPGNCGACGNRCAAGGHCVTGICVTPTCAVGQFACPGGCTNVTSDPNNCGQCGNTCAAGGTCVTGICVTPTCAVGQIECPGGCTDVTSDPHNCGMCGNACAAGSGCVTGICVAATPTPTPLITRGGRMIIMDATGRIVGTSGTSSILTDSPITVVLRVKDRPVLFTVDQNGFVPGSSIVYFESSDCSGSPLVSAPTADLIQSAQIVPEGDALYLYLPHPNATPAVRTVASFRNANGSGCTAAACSPGCPTFSTVPATKVIDLNTQFTPPFHVR